MQKIDAVTKVPEQSQFETTQHRLRGAGCASKCLNTVQVIKEKFREAGLMFKNP
ncbi:Uncharacterised protein [Enterobacter cloacae]|nr:Uncharacterised protein [Enterobacter cloacae]